MHLSRNAKGLSAHALHPATRSRTVFIALLLLPALGGLTSTLPAQGPWDNSKDYSFLMTTVGSDLDRVCAGDSVIFNVLAVDHVASKSVGGGSIGFFPINGVMVNGSVLSPSNGTLEPASSRTASLSTNNGSTVFTFAGLSPGRTELNFTGVLAAVALKSKLQTYIPLKMPVNVVSCEPPMDAGAGSGVLKNRKAEVKKVNVKTIPKVKVTTISKVRVTTTSTWSAGMDIVATIDEGVMDADGQGRFAGSADVNWQTSVIGTASCGAAEYRIAPSRADLTGEIDASNQLVVTITFQPRDFSGFANCGPVSGSTANIATPDPLTVSVETTGGTSTQPHAVTARNGAFVGSVTVVVTPERE